MASDSGKSLARTIARDFSAAAPRYESHADLQRRMGSELAGLLGALLGAQTHPHVLDAGCGTGQLLAALRKRRTHWRLIGADLAPGMCAEAARQTCLPILCADVSVLPLADGALDAVICNAALQWLPDPAAAFAEWRRVLRPGGLVLFATFGPATLQELDTAFAAVDHFPHRQVFPSKDGLMAAARTAGLMPLQADRRIETLSYADLRALMHSLRAIGATNKHPDRRRALLTPRQFAQAEIAYPAKERHHLTASWEIIQCVLSCAA